MSSRWSLVAIIVGCGCYHPNPAIDVPCSPSQTCPDNQICDTSQAPPLCVTMLEDAAPVSHDAAILDSSPRPIDARPDAMTSLTPITFVQQATTKPTAIATTLTLPSAVGAHDAIIVCLNYPSASNATLASITDSLGDNYMTVVGPIDSGGAMHYVAIAPNVKLGADTLTVTLSAAPSGGSDLFALEYSGIAHVATFDVSANQSGSTTAMTSGAATTTSAHELVLGYAEASAATSGAGFTSRSTQSGNLVEDMIVTSTGAYAATATEGASNNDTWTMIMATFRGQ